MGDNFKKVSKAALRAKAAAAFNSMREKAAEKGYISDAEIEAEIAAARSESGSAGSDS